MLAKRSKDSFVGVGLSAEETRLTGTRGFHDARKNGRRAGYEGGRFYTYTGRICFAIHSRYAQVQLDKFRTNATRFCDLGGIMDANNTCLFTVLDLEEASPRFSTKL